MKSVLLILALGLLAADEKGGDADRPTKAVEGTWQLTSIEANGQKTGGDSAPDVQMVIKGDTYKQIEMGTETEQGRFKLDASASPRTIDLDIRTGDDKGKKQLGIYKVQGDTLTLCLAPAGGTDRPKAFDAPQGSNFGLIVFKRKKG